MHTLTKLYAKKMFRQKLIYIFFACFLTASFCYSFLISTPQMEEMLNIDIAIVGEENFPEFMMRFYVWQVDQCLMMHQKVRIIISIIIRH